VALTQCQQQQQPPPALAAAAAAQQQQHSSSSFSAVRIMSPLLGENGATAFDHFSNLMHFPVDILISQGYFPQLFIRSLRWSLVFLTFCRDHNLFIPWIIWTSMDILRFSRAARL